MASISGVTEEVIQHAVATDDLTDALFEFQTAVGIDSGDVAGRVFGFGWSEEWVGATPARRREMMNHYIERERHDAAASDDEDFECPTEG